MSGLVNWFKGLKGNPTVKEPSAPSIPSAPAGSNYEKIYACAFQEVGVKEVSGNKDHPRIIEYLKSAEGYSPSNGYHDEIAWCACFVGWVLEKCGLKSTNRADAVSYLKWGVPLAKPVKGCVMVLQHPSGGHHVTFFDHEDSKYVYGLGGNQGNAVNISKWAKSEVMKNGYRGPA